MSLRRVAPRCEPDWLERPLSILVTHISATYHHWTRDQLPSLVDLADEAARHPCLQPELEAHAARLLKLVMELAEEIETHAWTEDDLFFPALVALEHPDVLRSRLQGASLKRMVDMVTDEHARIRRLIDSISLETSEFTVPSDAPSSLGTLIRWLATVTRRILEGVDLEDRCLIPRARLVASQP
jgi:iron-sulfur cluster repair protein YtfE (RIC family)